jgi:hypothetical protein
MPLFRRQRDAPDEDFNPAVRPARQEAMDALPEGWTLLGADHERFGLFRPGMDAWAASAEGPHGERTLAVGLTEQNAYIQLARRLRGELPESEGWAPPDHMLNP